MNVSKPLLELTNLRCHPHSAMASNFYRDKDGPKFILGHALELGFAVAGLISVVILRINYARINKQRDLQGTGSYTLEEMSRMGDRSPSFRYVL